VIDCPAVCPLCGAVPTRPGDRCEFRAHLLTAHGFRVCAACLVIFDTPGELVRHALALGHANPYLARHIHIVFTHARGAA
jgi:hypothetical protein